MNRSDTQAHAAAKLYLEMRRFSIIELNWRRSKQQIDIVAKKGEVIYLVTVYYTADLGKEIDHVQALSASRLKQLHQAAESWAQEEKWDGHYQLAAVEIGDPNFAVISFADNLS
jgi:Holliday junction resolvase-like predicted endonuclease